MNVFVIKQYQPCADYNGEPIAVFDNYEKAVEQCNKLNKKYSEGVEIYDDCYDFEINDGYDYDCIHAYTIECFELNKEIPYLD
jgi:hypothetical protein